MSTSFSSSLSSFVFLSSLLFAMHITSCYRCKFMVVGCWLFYFCNYKTNIYIHICKYNILKSDQIVMPFETTARTQVHFAA